MKKQIVSFWESRNIKFQNISENEFIGKRGSIIGNLFSYNMQNLITKLSVRIINTNEIICELDIKTIFQQITNWNKEYWQLELDTFETYLLNNDLLENNWEEYYKRSKKLNIIWTICLVIIIYAVVKIAFYLFR